MALIRRGLLAGIGLAAIGTLVACSGAQPQTGSSDEISGEIRFSTWFGEGDIEMWEDVIDGFTAEYPDVTVKFEPLAYEQYFTKLNTEFASGNAPDVMGLQFQSSVWGPSGLLAPLTADVAGEIGQLPESLILPGQATVDGVTEQFALPWRFVGSSLYGNLSAMADAGISRPDSWTLDELVEAAQKLTTDDAFGLLVPPGGAGEAAIASTFGASAVSEDGQTATFDTDAMIAHKTFLRDLIYEYKVSPAPDVLSDQQDPFASGKVRMAFLGSWSNPVFREAITDFDWDILPNPSGENEASNYTGPDLLGVYGNSKNTAAAKAFIEYAVFHEDAQKLIASTGIPVLTELATDPARVETEAELGPKNYGYFIEQATENGTGWNFVPAFADILALETDAHYAIMSDPNSDIPAILKELNTQVQDALDRDR